jgi:hypothetical protein
MGCRKGLIVAEMVMVVALLAAEMSVVVKDWGNTCVPSD